LGTSADYGFLMNILQKTTTLLALSLFSAAAFFATAADIAQSPDTVRPLLNGMTVPAISVLDQAGKTVDLTAVIKQKPTVLVFYRGGWCPYCNTQLAGLQQIEGEFAELGYQIIAISPEAPLAVSKSQQSTKEVALSYTLLSDEKLNAAKAFGIAYYLDAKTTALYKGSYGINLTYDSTGQAVLPAPAVYVLNKEAEVQFSYVHINYKTRLQPELLLLAAKLAKG
jgi:peroxiredoxin